MSHKRSVEDKRRLKKLADTTRWPIGAWYSDEKDRYYRFSASDIGDSHWLKRDCNRRLRRRNALYQRGQYHKATEYWWALF